MVSKVFLQSIQGASVYKGSVQTRVALSSRYYLSAFNLHDEDVIKDAAVVAALHVPPYHGGQVGVFTAFVKIRVVKANV